MITAEKIFSDLKRVAPLIAFNTEWEEDPSFVWDGDGPDPAEDGYVAYDVDVYARAVVDGVLAEGRDSLGGSYTMPDKKDRMVSGYLPDMISRAADELAGMTSGAIKKQAEAASKFANQVGRLLQAEYRKARGRRR